VADLNHAQLADQTDARAKPGHPDVGTASGALVNAEPDGLASNGGETEADAEALQEQVEQLRLRVQLAEERRRALVHIMGDLNESNQKLADQRKAMLHILGDYEDDRSRLARQTERLDNSRRALLHILKDSHESNIRLGDSRKAMIHIMGDLRETTQEMERREQDLRDKQEQLVQAGKLATLGELTTGVAHELNNPLNNIGLYVGNVIDQIRLGEIETEHFVSDLEKAMEQVRKATDIISHLRTFGRAAPVSIEQVDVDDVIERSLLLVHEQLRLRGIEVELELCPDELLVLANPIQLEQVFINLLTNARDALEESRRKVIRIASAREDQLILIAFSDTGPGIPQDIQQRIFDPFFTTKEVGAGTGLGLSITYSILKEYGGDITVSSKKGKGATFLIELPFAAEQPPEAPLL
jgi:C4-dicarboxylate-specific signal transduction histidine kinase